MRQSLVAVDIKSEGGGGKDAVQVYHTCIWYLTLKKVNRPETECSRQQHLRIEKGESTKGNDRQQTKIGRKLEYRIDPSFKVSYTAGHAWPVEMKVGSPVWLLRNVTRSSADSLGSERDR